MRRALLLVLVKLLKLLERPALLFLNGLLALAGQRRVSFDWPNHDVVEAAFQIFDELEAERLEPTPINLPVDAEHLNFRIHGRHVRLWVEQYGKVVLWGPRAIVTDLTERIATKLSAATPEQSHA
jgi:hypothetical protein